MSTGRARSNIASSKKARIDYVADFETTTDPSDCRVWGWGFCPVNDAETGVEIGQTIEEFIERVQRHNMNVYFHNLKFDGTFIIDWLLKNGYVHSTSHFAIEPGEFKSLISDTLKFYSITVKWKNGKTTEFRDSLKKLPMSVSRIATSFKLGETKGDLDYTAKRLVGHVITPEEADYIRRDVIIVAQALRLEMAAGMTKLTVASDSLNEYKKLFGAKNFQRVFPTLPEQMDREIRLSYRGGFTYKDKRRNGVQRSGLVLDVNSLYPHIMYSSVLPYGEPEYQRGIVELTEHRPLSIFSVTFTAHIKLKHIPCIQVKGHSVFVQTEYLEHIEEPTTLWVTSTDWELWNEHYNIDVISYNGGWSFKGARGFFDDYIDKWMAVKANSTGGSREIAKLHLNSLYGKFASNPNVTSKVPTLENGHVRFITGDPETRPPVYTAMGSFITAYARALTIRAAQANYDTFAYADTDSLHLLTDTVPTGINVHPSELGAWKLEYHFTEALYVRAKFYLERDCVTPKGEHMPYVNRMAGVPEHVSERMTFADVIDGAVIHGKLTPRNVPGGIVLMDSPFTIKL